MTPTYRLGAIELIELGASGQNSPEGVPVLRRPFLGSRTQMLANPVKLAGVDFLATIGSFLTGAFEYLLVTLADLVNVPLDLASSGVGLLFDGVAGLLINVPIIGVLASEILLLAKSVLQWGLSVPGLLLEGVGNIFGEIKGAIDATMTTDEKKKDEAEAKDKILDRAEQRGGTELRDAVEDAIDGKVPAGADNVPPQQFDLPPGADQIGRSGKSDIEKVLEVGLPVAGAATLVFLALT